MHSLQALCGSVVNEPQQCRCAGRTEGGINFIHDVEGGGLVVVQGKDQGEGAECLLPARQVGDVLPALLGRPHTEHYALHKKEKEKKSLSC